MAYITKTDLQDFLQIEISSETWATKLIGMAQKVVEDLCGTSWADADVPYVIQLAVLEVAGIIVQRGEAHWEEKQRDQVDNLPNLPRGQFLKYISQNVLDLCRPYITANSKSAYVAKHFRMYRPTYEDTD